MENLPPITERCYIPSCRIPAPHSLYCLYHQGYLKAVQDVRDNRPSKQYHEVWGDEYVENLDGLIHRIHNT